MPPPAGALLVSVVGTRVVASHQTLPPSVVGLCRKLKGCKGRDGKLKDCGPICHLPQQGEAVRCRLGAALANPAKRQARAPAP